MSIKGMERFSKTTIALLIAVGFVGQLEAQVVPTTSVSPVISLSGAKIDAFVPSGFKIEKTAKGDLNTDDLKDIALFVKNNAESFSSAKANNAPMRILIILFAEKNTGGFKLVERTDAFSMPGRTDTLPEPLVDLTIEGGEIKIRAERLNSKRTNATSIRWYRLGYVNREFVLTGAQRLEYDGDTTQQSETRDYDFTAKRLTLVTGKVPNPPRVQRMDFTIQVLQTLKGFPGPFKWEIEPGVFI